MLSLQPSFSKGIYDQARAFSFFRKACKQYLASYNREYDKFSLVSHDSYTGFITEYYMKEFFKKYFKNSGVQINSWDEKFDLKKINRILSTHSKEKKDISYVEEYFYDQYDLALTKGGKSLFIDIKTALTALQPTQKWNFLYPVVQAHKKGKDLMVLVYFVVEDISYPESLTDIILAGFISEETIRKCKKIKKGEKTKFGTISRIDNYITLLSKHYTSDLDKLKDLF